GTRPSRARRAATTSPRRLAAPGRVTTAIPGASTAVSSTNVESGWASFGGSSITRIPQRSSAATYARCWERARSRSGGPRRPVVRPRAKVAHGEQTIAAPDTPGFYTAARGPGAILRALPFRRRSHARRGRGHRGHGGRRRVLSAPRGLDR